MICLVVKKFTFIKHRKLHLGKKKDLTNMYCLYVIIKEYLVLRKQICTISNYIKGKFCVSVCVYVRYRTYLNVVGMSSKLLGVLRRTLVWFFTSKKLKKQIFKIYFFKREKHKKR
jgi:hypothetical protein